MGSNKSKQIDNTGEIVNNLTFENTDNKTIIWLLVAIIAILLADVGYKVYVNHRRGLRKRYLNSPARLAVLENNTV